jgi:acetyl esterase/lipase
MTRWLNRACWTWVLLGVWCVCSSLQAAEETVLLWPEGAPGKVGDEPTDKPWLWLYPADPARNTQTAVVICPGGGYAVHAVDHEGTQVARWFNSIGVNAYVLKYRLAPRYKHPAMMQDVQRAIQHVRAHADQYHVAADRIGVMGFSAGGHLASTCATHFLEADPQSADPVSKVPSRPDFAVLAYPVISMTEDWGHRGSLKNLLGENPDPELAKSLSNDQMVTPQTPPTFLFHTAEDAGVPPQNSVAFFAACLKHKVPAELHVYQKGPHGVGLAPGYPDLAGWKEHVHFWLKNNNLLAKVPRAAVKGMIKVRGEPLKWGQVAFVPDNEAYPTAVAMVRNGNYQLPAENGPTQGRQRVRIVHMGDVAPGPTVTDAVDLSSTAITVEVQREPNTFDFNVE